MNVSLTGAVRRWCMTERSRRGVHITPDALTIGRSRLQYEPRQWCFEIRERGCPLPLALRGTVCVQPLGEPGVTYRLDRAGHHQWTPLAPRARVCVELLEPRVRWRGTGYLDSNRGERALAADFTGWQWSRSAGEAHTCVYYEPSHRRDPAWPLALQFSGHDVCELPPAHHTRLPRSGWGIERTAQCADVREPRVRRTLVDAPFYVRSLLSVDPAEPAALTVHESLDLNRLQRRWVQALLPFRMPRPAIFQRRTACSSASS